MEMTMQTIAEIMSLDVVSMSPRDTLRRAAELMDELNVGAIPVCDENSLVGMITDRDITVRATSAGQAPDDVQVGDVMSVNVRTCYDNQPVDEVLEQMGDSQLRRIPVLDHRTEELVGIVSLGDMATEHSAGVDRTLENISTPSQPDRPRT
jgi:CBS domain-containing protein